jgi:hypothetical protein
VISLDQRDKIVQGGDLFVVFERMQGDFVVLAS